MNDDGLVELLIELSELFPASAGIPFDIAGLAMIVPLESHRKWGAKLSMRY